MVRVKRPVSPPSASSRRIKAAKQHVDELSGARRSRNGALSFEFQDPAWLEDLERMFHRKCAFCEQKIKKGETPKVHHFRPLPDLSSSSAKPQVQYRWLAFEWRNLYLACPTCHSLKASKFPVAGRRAGAGSYEETVAQEKPLLLDPCNDYPESFFDFTDDGRVIPSKNAVRGQDTRLRAETTIALLRLNRPELVEARAVAVREVLNACRAITSRTHSC